MLCCSRFFKNRMFYKSGRARSAAHYEHRITCLFLKYFNGQFISRIKIFNTVVTWLYLLHPCSRKAPTLGDWRFAGAKPL